MLSSFTLFSQVESDVFVPLGKYIGKGDSKSLSAWFADNMELDILGDVNECSKSQAVKIIENFFTRYTPKSFDIIHKSGKAPMKYAVGELSAGGEKFVVTLFVKIGPDNNLVQQIRIEKR